MKDSGSSPLLPAVLKGTAATVLLVIAYATLPMIGTAAAFLIPLPAVHYGFQDRRAAVSIVALTAASLAAILGWEALPIYIIMAAVTSLVISAGLGKRWSNGAILTTTAGTAIAAGAAGAAILYLVAGTPLDTVVQEGMTATTKAVAELYRKVGISGEDLQVMEQALRVLREMTLTLYPALGVAFVILSGASTLILLRRMKSSPEMEEFRHYHNPELLIWVIIAAGLILLVPDDVVRRWGLNLLAAGLSLYLVQGFAVLVFYLDKFRIPPILRAVLFILMVVQPYLVIATLVVGLFDLWARFRTTRTTNL